ncbi:uncharacterized protein BX663DRAFT_553740 [Cokeromyces recurvatus]|uniref:uncharacterized protein n=1 Tax=Cokeromyces recurvatus TaxID=90255 RepID=UPI00222109C1|nr:uncharacterized protein BX663DRAFT_553740 [Cokeromyces recurvatus]KAI7900744.1 hypothetical protein BX663DRAFT_553740 [Cokeromyces recurvatus]
MAEKTGLIKRFFRIRENLAMAFVYSPFFILSQKIFKTVKTIRLDCLQEFKKNITNTPDTEDTTIASQVLFLEEIFAASFKLYKINVPLNHNEAIFNNYFVEPNLKAVCNSIDHSKYNWAKLGFFDGEEELLSMTKQLKRKGKFVDHRYIYKADGVVRLQEAHDIEICVYASVDIFEQLKIYFVHAADEVFHFWREGVLNIEPKFEDKETYQQDIITFYWTFKCKLEESLDAVKKIQDSHKINRYNSGEKPKLLSQIINPNIIKLTENDHKKGMADLGPFDSPEHD